MLADYFPILLFIAVGLGVGIVAISAGRVLAPHQPYDDKLSPYECGVEAFEDTRMQFDVRYCLVAILFIVFDLEIALLFPWSIVLDDFGVFVLWSMFVFRNVPVAAFLYVV